MSPRAKPRGGALLLCRPAGAMIMSPRWGYDYVAPSEAEGWGFIVMSPRWGYDYVAPMGLLWGIAPRAKPRGGATVRRAEPTPVLRAEPTPVLRAEPRRKSLQSSHFLRRLFHLLTADFAENMISH